MVLVAGLEKEARDSLEACRPPPPLPAAGSGGHSRAWLRFRSGSGAPGGAPAAAGQAAALDAAATAVKIDETGFDAKNFDDEDVNTEKDDLSDGARQLARSEEAAGDGLWRFEPRRFASSRLRSRSQLAR